MPKTYETPQACGARKADIEALAERFAAKAGLKPAQPLEGLVRALGGKVRYLGLDGADRADQESILIEESGDFVISLPTVTTAQRDRFTIAHELGHYFLHFLPKRKPMAAKRYGSDRVEWEANWFAAGLLMPKQEFTSVLETFGRDIEKVATVFGVSRKAAEVRAKALGLTF